MQMKKSVCLTAVQLLQAICHEEEHKTLKRFVKSVMSTPVFKLFQEVPNPFIKRSFNRDAGGSGGSGGNGSGSTGGATDQSDTSDGLPAMSLNHFFEFMRCDPRFASYLWSEKMRARVQELVTEFHAKNPTQEEFWSSFYQRFSNEPQKTQKNNKLNVVK